jgi:hypothetical protein
LWRIFAIQWAVFFSSHPKTSLVLYSVRANICPSILAQEVLKEHSFCYELVLKKERSSIGGVIVARNRGFLPVPKGGNPIELLLFRVSTAINGAARPTARRPWSGY